MPITFKDISDKSIWFGYDWAIENKPELARLLARVALGQYRHVSKILNSTQVSESLPFGSAYDGARSLLISTQKDPWHRDGWVFQVISWIAANLKADGELIAPPHMQHAGKGFDGLHININRTTGKVSSAVLCEDKATTNSRKMIRDEVWPEFKSFETGARDHELVAMVTTLLETNPDVDPDGAIAGVLWDNARSYRVAVTVDDNNHSIEGLKKLFKGYDDNVNGKPVRRRAEVFHTHDLRAWMDDLVEMSLTFLRQLELENV